MRGQTVDQMFSKQYLSWIESDFFFCFNTGLLKTEKTISNVFQVRPHSQQTCNKIRSPAQLFGLCSQLPITCLGDLTPMQQCGLQNSTVMLMSCYLNHVRLARAASNINSQPCLLYTAYNMAIHVSKCGFVGVSLYKPPNII